jgi:hypothetical protein
MDFEILKKKLDAYKTAGGSYKKIKGGLLVELLRAWEEHKGPSTALARQLGMKRGQLARQIREARKAAIREEAVDPAFEALQIPSSTERVPSGLVEIVLSWGGDKVVRFPSVDLLVDFLRKAA